MFCMHLFRCSLLKVAANGSGFMASKDRRIVNRQSGTVLRQSVVE